MNTSIKMKIYIGLILIIVYHVLPGKLFSQGEIQKEVRVIKPYSPTLSDASKINLLPEFGDTAKENPEFEYKIFPRMYETEFRINPIKPAKMVGLPLPKLYKSQITFGLGNYLTPLAELSVNELRSKTNALALYFKHHSSHGKVKLENNRKVDSDFSDNILRLYGKKMFYRSVVEGGLSGGYNSVLYYGYEPSLDTFLVRKEIKQKINSGGARVRAYSTNPDSSHFNYDAGLTYDIVSDRFKSRENGFVISTKLSTMVKEIYAGGDLKFQYYDFNSPVDTSANIIFDISPYFSKRTAEWRFLLGFTTSFDTREKTSFGIYPRAEFEFNIVKDVLVPYFGLSGRREINNYQKIIFENPYIKPGIRFRNTDYNLIGYAGLKGCYSSRLSYNLKASYTQADSMIFYVNDSGDTLRNQFIPLYDKVSVLSLNGELTWHHSDKIQFLIKGNYYAYDPEVLEKPWHKPVFELSFGAGYNISQKILANANIFYNGKRYAQGVLADPLELKPYMDINFSVEYRYTSILSFFIKLNNCNAVRYQIWNQYPAQKFQIMGGFSYAL